MTFIAAGTCSRTDPRCSKVGVARCSTCKAWYCSARCQADHWPRHWRECLPLPDLEWLVQDDQNQSPVFVKKNPSSTTSKVDPSVQAVKVGSAKLHDVPETESISPEMDLKSVPKKTIDVGSTDSSLQAEGPEVTTPTKNPPPDSGKQEDKESEVDKAVDLQKCKSNINKDVSSAVSGTDSAPLAVTRTSSRSPGMYAEAHYTGILPAQTLAKKVNVIISPVDVVESPSNFVVRFADKVSSFLHPSDTRFSTYYNFFVTRRQCVSNCCQV